MMKREKRKKTEKNQENVNNLVYISVSILAVAIVAFVVSFIVYGNYTEDNFQIEKSSYDNMNSASNYLDERIELQTAKTSSSIGKGINEVNNNNDAENKKKDEVNTKVAINTSKKEKANKKEGLKNNNEKKPVKEKKEEIKKEGKKEEQKEDKKEIKQEERKDTKIEQTKENPTFEKPVEGNIVKGYAKENLVYSNTLKEWTTHNGVDIEAEKTTVVKTSAKGRVKSIKNDPRYGLTVIVEHSNGFETIYANLLSTEFVVEGEELEKGQSIGTVGNTATFEISDNAHLHFEILKDGEYLDPEIYIE